MTKFSDLPYEIRLKIIKINVKIAFKNQSKKFEKVYEPKIMTNSFSTNWKVTIKDDEKCEFYIMTDNDYIIQSIEFFNDNKRYSRRGSLTSSTWLKFSNNWCDVIVENRKSLYCDKYEYYNMDKSDG